MLNGFCYIKTKISILAQWDLFVIVFVHVWMPNDVIRAPFHQTNDHFLSYSHLLLKGPSALRNFPIHLDNGKNSKYKKAKRDHSVQ